MLVGRARARVLYTSALVHGIRRVCMSALALGDLQHLHYAMPVCDKFLKYISLLQVHGRSM